MATAEASLAQAAQYGSIDHADWPTTLEFILTRLDHTVYHEFPVPSVVLPPASQRTQAVPSTPARNKSEDPPSSPPEPTPSAPSRQLPDQPASVSPPESTLPPSLLTTYDFIKRTLSNQFGTHPPHTLQRLAELILYPKRHYRFLHAYLNALDKAVAVSSGNNIFPLPSIDHTATTYVNGATSAPTSNGSTDDSLGGALLTPIPWLRENGGSGSPSPSTSTQNLDGAEAGLATTESMREQGGLTQGELLRQEQENSDPPAPVASLSARPYASPETQDEEVDEDEPMPDQPLEDSEQPHARGPEAIGNEDIGPQERATGIGQSLDMTAAVGRSPHKDVEIEGMTTETAAGISEGRAVEDGIDVEDADAILAAEKKEQADSEQAEAEAEEAKAEARELQEAASAEKDEVEGPEPEPEQA